MRNDNSDIMSSVADMNPDQLAGKYLTFSIGDEDYGLEIIKVREIIGMQEITPVPRTPQFVQGVINLRGKVIPVIDLRLKFELEYKEPDERTCIIVTEVQIKNNGVLMGTVVDRVNEVIDVKSEELEPAPSFGVSLDTSFILGLAKISDAVKTLLDIDKVLTESEVVGLSEI